MQAPHPLARRRWLALAAAFAAGLPAGARAAEVPLADSVKAAYLFKFVGYVDWPATAFAAPATPIVIGVSDADPVLAELQRMLPGRSVQGRPLVARKVAAGEVPPELHVLFAGRAAELAAHDWLQHLRDKPVLLVTNDPDGLRLGGMINFLLVQGRLRFEASVPMADRSGLKLSSRLLAVAERVVTTP